MRFNVGGTVNGARFLSIETAFMEWFVAGLMFAVFNAITMLINQHYRLDGHLISGLRGIFVGFIYIPLMFVVEFPHGAYFWSLILAEGALSAFFNARLYSSSAIYGAAATSTISVLAIAFSTVFWWLADFSQFVSLLKHPAVLFGIIAALGLVVWGFRSFSAAQKTTTKRGAVSYMMPAVVVFAAMLVIRKDAMDAVNFYSATVYYGGVSIFISGVFNMGVYTRKHGVDFLERKTDSHKVIKAGILMGVASATTVFFGNLSSASVPNPAYISALTLLSPLVIFAFDRYLGHSNGNKKIPLIPCLIMIFGLFLLVLLP